MGPLGSKKLTWLLLRQPRQGRESGTTLPPAKLPSSSHYRVRFRDLYVGWSSFSVLSPGLSSKANYVWGARGWGGCCCPALQPLACLQRPTVCVCVWGCCPALQSLARKREPSKPKGLSEDSRNERYGFIPSSKGTQHHQHFWIEAIFPLLPRN